MAEDAAAIVYPVPTHLQEREPFAFGRTVGEVAKLVLMGYAASRFLTSDALPLALRLPAAAVVVLIGLGWALVRIQRRPLEAWVAMAFRYGATSRRRVWRPAGRPPLDREEQAKASAARGWYELQRVRVRWAEPADASGQNGDAEDGLPAKIGSTV